MDWSDVPPTTDQPEPDLQLINHAERGQLNVDRLTIRGLC